MISPLKATGLVLFMLGGPIILPSLLVYASAPSSVWACVLGSSWAVVQIYIGGHFIGQAVGFDQEK